MVRQAACEVYLWSHEEFLLYHSHVWGLLRDPSECKAAEAFSPSSRMANGTSSRKLMR